ncbi:ankyrin [Artomyces pyxidatus]|uniref:Ankyrin n=1 Tax=Artomyces pyxidatus TaxID=48021 RepID=A0ACB8SEG5_9AGAM|nr:ankyrin [Artomyces pyxidatus]
MDVSAWSEEHGGDSLNEAIRQSMFDTFMALIEAGQDINSNEYLYSRDGRMPTLPVHVAATHPDPRFLAELLARGADADDDCQIDYPNSDNVFRSAVRAAQWDNFTTVLKTGGVHGSPDPDELWSEWHRMTSRSDAFSREDGEAHIAFILMIFRRPWPVSSDPPLILPKFELEHRRHNVFRFYSLASCSDEQPEDAQLLSNLDWLVSVELPHLTNTLRVDLVLRLIASGADVSYYTAPSPASVWNARAHSLPEKVHPYHDSPWQHLGPTYCMPTTPLHECVRAHNEDMLRALISQAGFNPNIPEFDTGALPPLFLALSLGDARMCHLLVELGADLAYETPFLRLTAIHFAASARSISLIRWLVGETLAICAADVARDLLGRTSLFGHSALHVACMPTVTQMSSPSQRTTLSIHHALPDGTSRPSAEVLQALLEAGAGSWDLRDHQGNTPGHFLAAAVEKGGGDGLVGMIPASAMSIENEFGETVMDILGNSQRRRQSESSIGSMQYHIL